MSESFRNEPVDKSTWTENAGLRSHLRSILYWLGCSSTFTELATTDDWVDYVPCLDTFSFSGEALHTKALIKMPMIGLLEFNVSLSQ